MNPATTLDLVNQPHRPQPGPPRRLHVAVVDEELPYPMNSGKRIRTLNLLLRLAGRHRITYLSHRNSDPDEAAEAARFLRDHGIEPVVVDRAVPPKSGPLFYARLAANLLSPLPYSVATHASYELRAAVAAYATLHPVDLWQCEWTPYAQVLRGMPGLRRLVVAHNVESQIWQRYHETETHPLKRWYIRRQWRKFRDFERRAFAEADRTVAVSPDDARKMTAEFGAGRVDVVDNGVDTDYFRPLDRPRDPARILFLGSLDWRPNLDAVKLLLERVYPQIKPRWPDARLCLVGRNPPEWLRKQAAEAGAELHANVPDVRQFLAECGVLAVPLRIGGGSRLKILEALASGLPVVSTKVGAEGLCLEPGRHLTVVETVEDMAGALTRCLADPEEARAEAERGRQCVVERYDWGILAERLERVWLDCVTAVNSPLPLGERGRG